MPVPGTGGSSGSGVRLGRYGHSADHQKHRRPGSSRQTLVAHVGTSVSLLKGPTSAIGTLADRESRMEKKKSLVVGAAALVVAEAAVVARRRGTVFGIHSVVRCRRGHLFTTIWIPGASVKSLRLGWWRYQRCPVGKHWSLVTPVKESELTEQERREAAARRDTRLA
jgi:hypothetical protein